MAKTVDIVVGGQFGSEGKGKVAYLIAKSSSHRCVARIGGSNSGHTAKGCVLRHLPVSVLIPNGVAIIGSGSYINPKVLEYEIANSLFKPNLYIDSKAVIIKSREPEKLSLHIVSTLSGTGEAVKERISRDNSSVSIKELPKFKKYLANTNDIHSIINMGCVLEGTQGFGLSLIHSPYYPYVTSRDTTASGFISELGVSPNQVNRIYMVIRTFPIRVAGNSGPLPNECTWESIGVKQEYTSVTNKIRRVGRFDPEIIIEAIRHNNPSHIILNHLDYIEKANRLSFVNSVERSINRKINYIGLGPNHLEKRK